MDYEKIAEEVQIPGVDPSPAGPPDESPEAAQARINRAFLPLDHEKYKGLAAAKGYAQGDDYSGHRLQKVNYTHEALIEVLIFEPHLTQNELAARFDRSVSWISIVMGSDAFQAALAKRRDDILDPFLIATIEERLRGLAQQSLSVIAEKLEKTQNVDLAVKGLEIATKALGFGARNNVGAVTTNNFVVQLPGKARDSTEWARNRAGAPTIEIEAKDV